jgi:hypothetical protein
MLGCTSNGQDMRRQVKLNCYADTLKNMQNESLYKEVMSQFVDTFKIMKNDKRYFGVPEVVSNKIDEAIFFNKNKTECLLIALQRSSSDFMFATARIIQGTLQGEKWVFEASMTFSYSKDFINLYPENSFENISKLARYSVLKAGNTKKGGCEIDDNYWFVLLNK